MVVLITTMFILAYGAFIDNIITNYYSITFTFLEHIKQLCLLIKYHNLFLALRFTGRSLNTCRAFEQYLEDLIKCCKKHSTQQNTEDNYWIQLKKKLQIKLLHLICTYHQWEIEERLKIIMVWKNLVCISTRYSNLYYDER